MSTEGIVGFVVITVGIILVIRSLYRIFRTYRTVTARQLRPRRRPEELFDGSNSSVDGSFLALMGVRKGVSTPACPIVSLPQYIRTLGAGGSIDTERVILTMLLKIPIPPLLFASIASWAAAKAGPTAEKLVDVSSSGIGQLVSPITLSAICRIIHRTAIARHGPGFNACNGAQSSDGSPFSLCAAFIRGMPLKGSKTIEEDRLLQENMPIGGVFILEQDLPPLVDRLIDLEGSYGGAHGQSQLPNKPVSRSVLPDLYRGTIGTSRSRDATQTAVDRIMSVLMTRLASNSLPSLWRPSEFLSIQSSTFAVQLRPHGPVLRSVEDFLDAFRHDQASGASATASHSVRCRVYSRVTSFSQAVVVKTLDGVDTPPDSTENPFPSGFANVPLCFPVRTGIQHPYTGEQLTSILPHAAIRVSITGPLLLGSAEVDWCQHFKGLTAWWPAVSTNWPWQNSEDVLQWQTDVAPWSIPQERIAIRYSTILSVLFNHLAGVLDLPRGGYGYTGVCIDSVALVQQALGGSSSLFPLLLGGEAKVELLRLAADLSMLDPSVRDSLVELRNAILDLPCDCVVEPEAIPDACRRIVETLPPNSPFVLVPKAISLAREISSSMQKILASSASRRR